VFEGAEKGRKTLLLAMNTLALGMRKYTKDARIGLTIRLLPCRSRKLDPKNWERNRLISSPHVTIESSLENVTIDDWDQTIQEAEDVSGIKAITASASSNAFIKKGEKVEPALLRGFDFDEADKIYHMLDALYEGKRPQTNTQCILGKELGEELGVGVGANVSIITSFGTSHDLIISGLYDLGIESLNKAWVMTTVGAAQGIFQFGD